MRQKLLAFVAVFILSSALIAIGIGRDFILKPFEYSGTRLKTDLNEPDAYIRTDSLSSLPGDLLKVPMIRDVFTEDLAFYYDYHEDRMGIKGALKRIAYEHDLDLSDKIVSTVLDEPAQVLYWRDGHGALRHYALIIRQSIWTKIFKNLALAATDDTQLKIAGHLSTPDGKVAIYALEVSPRKTFLLLNRKDTLIALSDPGLALDGNGSVSEDAAAVLSQWLDDPSSLQRRFHLEADQKSAKHSLILKSSALAFGYDPFMNGFKALRFDFSEHWKTSAGFDLHKAEDSFPGDPKLWQALPANPAMCTLLPLDWNLLHGLIGKAQSSSSDLGELQQLKGSAMVCWYNESNLSTPLFVIHSKTPLANRDSTLSALSKWAFSDAGIIDKKRFGNPDAKVWKGKTHPTAIGSGGEFILFSPDVALVEKSLDTLARRFPNVNDQVATTGNTLAVFTPKSLSTMANREITRAIDGTGDANLLAIVQTHLPARMDALSKYDAYKLEISGNLSEERFWYPIEWQPIKGRP